VFRSTLCLVLLHLTVLVQSVNAAESDKLVSAASHPAQEPNVIVLRYLQTLTEIAADKNPTILFPLPLELIKRATIPGSTEQTAPE
jgi:hypothetical protein